MIAPIKSPGGCFRLTGTALAALLVTAGIAAGIGLAVKGVQLRSDTRNPQTPQGRTAIFAHPRDFMPVVYHARKMQVSGIETIHYFSMACWRGLILVVLLLIINVFATPADRRKKAWSTVLFAGLILLLFFVCSWAASPAFLGLPVPADWPPAPGPIPGATMYFQVVAAMGMMKTVMESWIATGILTIAVFAALLWQTIRLFRFAAQGS